MIKREKNTREATITLTSTVTNANRIGYVKSYGDLVVIETYRYLISLIIGSLNRLPPVFIRFLIVIFVFHLTSDVVFAVHHNGA